MNTIRKQQNSITSICSAMFCTISLLDFIIGVPDLFLGLVYGLVIGISGMSLVGFKELRKLESKTKTDK